MVAAPASSGVHPINNRPRNQGCQRGRGKFARILAALVVLSATSIIGCAADPAAIARGIDDARKRDREERADGVRRAAELCRRAADAFRVGRLDDAWRDWSLALRENPDCAPARNGRGMVKAARGEIESAFGSREKGALAEFDEAIRLDPASAEYLTNRGYNRARVDDISGAAADFDRAIALEPDHAGAFLNRGLLKALTGDHAGAVIDYTRAIELRPDYYEAFNNRGVARGNLGDSSAALRDFETACKLRPDYPGAQINRLGTMVLMGDRVRAVFEAENLERDPAQSDDVRRWAREYLQSLRKGERH